MEVGAIRMVHRGSMATQRGATTQRLAIQDMGGTIGSLAQILDTMHHIMILGGATRHTTTVTMAAMDGIDHIQTTTEVEHLVARHWSSEPTHTLRHQPQHLLQEGAP